MFLRLKTVLEKARSTWVSEATMSSFQVGIERSRNWNAEDSVAIQEYSYLVYSLSMRGTTKLVPGVVVWVKDTFLVGLEVTFDGHRPFVLRGSHRTKQVCWFTSARHPRSSAQVDPSRLLHVVLCSPFCHKTKQQGLRHRSHNKDIYGI